MLYLGRRLTPGDGYLEALVKPSQSHQRKSLVAPVNNVIDVRYVHREITKIVPEGLVDDTGELHKVDYLICATGFNIAFTPPLYTATPCAPSLGPS